MDKDKEVSAVEQFLGESGIKDINPFDENPENPFEQPEVVEEKGEVVVEEEEKPLPFNKDPKIQKFIEKEISKRLESFKVEQKPATETKADDEVTDVLTRLIGNDTPEKVSMVKEFRNILEKGTERAKSEAIAELEARQNAELEADKQAERELEVAFENIEETYKVDFSTPLGKKTRQEFVSFVEKIAPKRNGEIVDYPDMPSAWETFQEIKKAAAPANRAKDLASRSMARSSGTEAKPDTKGLGFDNILEHLEV